MLPVDSTMLKVLLKLYLHQHRIINYLNLFQLNFELEFELIPLVNQLILLLISILNPKRNIVNLVINVILEKER